MTSGQDTIQGDAEVVVRALADAARVLDFENWAPPCEDDEWIDTGVQVKAMRAAVRLEREMDNSP